MTHQPTAFIEAIEKFYSASANLCNVWQDSDVDVDQNFASEAYPFKESFDETLHLIGQWLLHQKQGKHPTTDPYIPFRRLADTFKARGYSVTFEGDGTGCPFVSVVLSDGRIVVIGDVNGPWGANVYANQDAYEQGNPTVDNDWESSFQTSANPEDVVTFFQSKFQHHDDVDEMKTLGAVASEFRRRGYDAEVWHSGGGIMTVRVVVGTQEWIVGNADATWGADICDADGGLVAWKHTDVSGNDAVAIVNAMINAAEENAPSESAEEVSAEVAADLRYFWDVFGWGFHPDNSAPSYVNRNGDPTFTLPRLAADYEIRRERLFRETADCYAVGIEAFRRFEAEDPERRILHL